MSESDRDRAMDMLESAGTDLDNNAVAEALKNLLGVLRDEEQVNMFSDLSNEDIRHLSVMETLGDETTESFADNFKTLKVSRNRDGRKEIIKLAEAVGGQKEDGTETGKIKSVLNRIR